jgi:hypothetical protein
MISPESLQVHMKEKKTTEGTPSNQAKQDSTLPKNTGHERLIKNEYEYDFNVEDDDDFLPDAVKNFQEEHNLTEFRGLTKTKTYGNQDGTYGANSRPGKATNPKTKDVKIKEQNSLDLLGDI